MFKKIELWIVGIIILFFILILLLFAGILRDAYLEKNRTPKFLRKNLMTVAKVPSNIYKVINHIIEGNTNAPPKLQKHKDKKKFKQFIEKERNALLVLPRYDHSLSRSVVDIVDINNFKTIHTYKHDIDEMNDQVKNIKEFPRLKIDGSKIRFSYTHPILLEDGSIISHSEYSIKFKIDFCSNLKWINNEEIFHHSNMLDHDGNIWSGGQMNPKSKYVKKYSVKNEEFQDDSIIKINTDGKILFNKSITEIMLENNLIDEIFFKIKYADPIHVNDIEPAFSDTEYWKKGDVFISIRNQSAIIHYRPINNQVVNYITGDFSMQHDVDIISDEEISIFNNNNFLVNNEYSEVVIYNFKTRTFRKAFNDQLKKENFKTYSGGLQHFFKDGSLLIDEDNHGRIFLINNQGEKEWEFVNKDINGDIGHVNWSRAIEDELFIEKFKSLIKDKKCLN